MAYLLPDVPVMTVEWVITMLPHRNCFTALFPGPPGWAGARRELLDFMVQGKINRGRNTNHLAGRHSIWTNHCPPPPSPQWVIRVLLIAWNELLLSHWRCHQKVNLNWVAVCHGCVSVDVCMWYYRKWLPHSTYQSFRFSWVCWKWTNMAGRQNFCSELRLHCHVVSVGIFRRKFVSFIGTLRLSCKCCYYNCSKCYLPIAAFFCLW